MVTVVLLREVGRGIRDSSLRASNLSYDIPMKIKLVSQISSKEPI
jgi:hypothetical protein